MMPATCQGPGASERPTDPTLQKHAQRQTVLRPDPVAEESTYKASWDIEKLDDARYASASVLRKPGP